MPAWSSYSLADFVPYSLSAWYRLMAGTHQAIWPASLLLWLLAMAWLLRLLRAPANRRVHWSAGIGLALLWAWVGIGFVGMRYAQLNWFAGYLAMAFVAQAALLLVAGMLARKSAPGVPAVVTGRTRRLLPDWPGLVLLGYAVALHPGVEPLLFGRPWDSAAVFGIDPTATAIGSLGWLLLLPAGRIAWLAPIPVIWLAFALLTRLVIET